MGYQIPFGAFEGEVIVMLPLPDHAVISSYHGARFEATVPLPRKMTREQIRTYLFDNRETLGQLIDQLVQVDPRAKKAVDALALKRGKLSAKQLLSVDDPHPDLLADLYDEEFDPWDTDNPITN